MIGKILQRLETFRTHTLVSALKLTEKIATLKYKHFFLKTGNLTMN